LAQIRFFQYMPKHICDSLSTAQKTAIAQTILELLTNDPRILDEIYMEQPYAGMQPGKFSFWRRIFRRSNWVLRRLWLSMLRQKSERRARWRFADYLFIVFSIVLLSLGLFLIILFLYELKSMLHVDIFPYMHFFTVE